MVLTVVAAVAASIATAPSAAVPADGTTPVQRWVLDGTVSTVTATAAGVYVAGDFTLIGRPTGAWVGLDAVGRVRSARAPVEGSVTTAVGDGSGGWFVRGSIESVGGFERHGIVHLRANGTFDRA